MARDNARRTGPSLDRMRPYRVLPSCAPEPPRSRIGRGHLQASRASHNESQSRVGLGPHGRPARDAYCRPMLGDTTLKSLGATPPDPRSKVVRI